MSTHKFREFKLETGYGELSSAKRATEKRMWTSEETEARLNKGYAK